MREIEYRRTSPSRLFEGEIHVIEGYERDPEEPRRFVPIKPKNLKDPK